MLKHKILVVDDESIIIDTIKDALKYEDYEIISASNGEEGLELYLLHKPILIILDLKMPKMNGLEFLERIKLKPLDAGVVLLTGHGSDDEIAACFEHGINAFMRKPFNYYEFIGMVRNMIALKNTTLELEKYSKNLEKKYNNLFEKMLDGLAQTNMSGEIVMCNPSFIEMLGYSKEEILKLGYKDLTPERWHSFELEIVKTQVLARGYSEIYEKEYIKKDGTVFPVELRSYLIQDKEGRHEGIWAIIRDITHRKRAEAEHKKLEEQYLQSQKMEAIGRLSGGIAHDFNNLLSIILGYSHLALTKIDRLNPLYQDIHEIKSAGQRSVDLISQLLTFARKQKNVPQIIHLNQRISNTEKMLRRLIGEDIEFKFIQGSELWTVKMDPSQIDQIIANLIVNSRDAIEGVGKIVVETSNTVLDQNFCSTHLNITPGEYVLLSFSDNGSGIDNLTIDKIFDPFFTTKGEKGTGLGLSTVYGIVTQNQGFIDVFSEKGKGTTFKIYIPKCENLSKVSSNILIDKSLKGTETILVVEDEELILTLCKRALEENGYNVITAGNPVEAIALVEKHQEKIHLLITDVIMPDMNGKELSEQIKALKPDIRILFMSGYTADVIGNLNLFNDELWFIHKPFFPEDLLKNARKILDN
ncbi:MAG: response regulator [Desulfobacterales bacterium]|nr:response regulator [Desulfobacterales bacterium]